MEYLLLLGLGGAIMLTALFTDDGDTSEEIEEETPDEVEDDILPETDTDLPEDDPADESSEGETIRVTGESSVTTGDGDDVILTANPTDGPVTVTRGAGDDIVDIEQETRSGSQVNAGDGDDIVRFDGGYAELNGGEGNDTLEAFDNVRAINGGEGNDLLIAHGDNSNLFGGEGDDTIAVDNPTTGEYLGGSGDDTFELDLGDYDYRHDIGERISGGDGDDVFNIINRSIRGEDLLINDDDIPDSYEFGISGDDGADTFEVTHQIDIGSISSEEPEFYMTNSTWIRDFDPDEDVLIVNPAEPGIFDGTPVLTIQSAETTNGSFQNYIDLAYTNEDAGVTATWRLHVVASRALTEDDVVLNLAA